MNKREKIIRLWFDMWLQQKDLGIDKIFIDDLSAATGNASRRAIPRITA